jgi:hypothetical protein
MTFRVLALMLWVFAFTGGGRAEAPYTDNRSTAADLVRSLYDAVNRHEYARAYDYFSKAPAINYAAYAKGFEHTAHVDVMTGEVSSDGAAGSVFYAVPTLIRSTDDNGGSKVFAGCYTLRAINAAIQEPPFRPLQIDQGVLKSAASDEFNTYSFPKCGNEPEMAAVDATAEDAKALFVAEQTGNCTKVEETRGGLNQPKMVTLKYRDEGAAAGDPDRAVTIYIFECTLAAYNATEVYYISDGISALHMISFAEPHMVIKRPAGDDEGAKLESMTVDGFKATTELVNSEIDEKVRSITSFSKWRGIGDASSSGTWTFINGEFVLTDFEVDPTYDEENNPIPVMIDGKLQ